MTVDFSHKKVLLFGLGSLGGGVATANWLLRQGAILTISDIKTEEDLAPSLAKIEGKATLHLGGQTREDIESHDVIVVNPGVSYHHSLIQYARELGKEIVNEATLFYTHCPQKKVAVTGTRGKTTTTNWIGYFLSKKYSAKVTGNSSSEPMLQVIDQPHDYFVTELSSFQLELFNEHVPSADTVVITNLLTDHLNRHASMEEYARVKANIFFGQAASDNLILNRDNTWTDFFLKQNPKSQIWFFSLKPLAGDERGLWYQDGAIYFENRKVSKVLDVGDFMREWGEHNLQNLLAAALTAYLEGVSWQTIQEALATIPQIPFRQEIVYRDATLTIINDTTATSPDGAIAAIKRFAQPTTILIAGGTDAGLDYTEWAKVLEENVSKENLVFLAGSATENMLSSLAWTKEDIASFQSLTECFDASLKKARSYPLSAILFSPAAKSFEKFKNEFDRGEQFNQLVKEKLK